MIKPLRLARVAARAEILVLQREAVGVARRAAFGAAAGVFALAALTLLHIIGYLALAQYAHLAPIASAAIIMAVDVVIAGVLVMLAKANTIDPVLEEAKRLRDQSIEQAQQSLTVASMVAPVTRIAADMGVVRLVVRVLSSVFRLGGSAIRRR